MPRSHTKSGCVVAVIALATVLLWPAFLSRANAQPTIPAPFSSAVERLASDEKLSLLDAVPFSMGGDTRYLVVVAKTDDVSLGLAMYWLVILKADTAVEVVHRESSTGIRLNHELSGTDVNGDGRPDVVAMTDPGGSSQASTTFSIITIDASGARAIYRGPLFKPVDLDGDGIVELIEIHEVYRKGESNYTYSALKWTSSKYQRAPALERRPSFRAIVDGRSGASAEGKTSLQLLPAPRGVVPRELSQTPSVPPQKPNSMSQAPLPIDGKWTISYSVGPSTCAGTLILKTIFVTAVNRGGLAGKWSCDDGLAEGGAVAGVNGERLVLYFYSGPATPEKRAYEMRGVIRRDSFTGKGEGRGVLKAIRAAE